MTSSSSSGPGESRNGFLMAFGGRSKIVEKKAIAPMRVIGDEDDNEENEEHVEMVTGFEDNIVQPLVPREEPRSFVIPALPNRDWRAAANRRRGMYLPEHEHDEAGAAKPEVLGTLTTTYGLQQPLKTPKTETNSFRDGIDVKMEDFNQSEPSVEVKAVEGTEVEQDKALALKAMEALVSEASGAGEILGSKSTLVIPSRSLAELEAEAFREDMEELPDEATLEDYENVPVEEFGAALLRGMGWKDGQAIGKNKDAPTKPIEAIQRQALLGLGAKPEPLSADNKRGKPRFGRSKAVFEFAERSLVVERRKGYDSDGGRSSGNRHSDREGSNGRERERLRDSDREARSSKDERRDTKRRHRSKSPSRSSSLERYKSRRDGRSSRNSSRESRSRRDHSRDKPYNHRSRR